MKVIISILAVLLTFGCTSKNQNVLPVEGFRKISDETSLEYQLGELTNQIVKSLTKTQTTKIAVIEFSDLDGNVTEFGRYLSEELITRLFLTNRFDVVERNMLNKVLEEQKLNMSGLFNENTIKRLGQLLGVDAIATGSITNMGQYVKVNARLISTVTGSVFSVASVKIKKDSSVLALSNSISSSVNPLPRKRNENFTPFLKGQVWKGSYTCRQGITSLELRIEKVSDNKFKTELGDAYDIVAIFDFDFRDRKVVGAFYLDGKYYSEKEVAIFSPSDWIKKPRGYSTVGMDGEISSDGKTFSGHITRASGCKGFQLRLIE